MSQLSYKFITNGLASVIAFMVVLICFFTMTIYTDNVLGGCFNCFFLPAKMFGIPMDLVEHGIEPFYYGEKETGWDGQFYYYMSNDLLGLKDTPQHIDAHAYRYQRIGLSLYTAIVAYLTLQSWVSPLTYYLSYVFLIMVAAWAATRIMEDSGGWRLTGLVWALGAGTQVTLLNGLPDAAADAFLILAVLAVLRTRPWIGSVFFTFSALSREVYIVFPAFYLAALLYHQYCMSDQSWRLIAMASLKQQVVVSLALPLLVFMVWHLYVRIHFGVSPSSQASEILGPPFMAWWDSFSSGLAGRHILVGPGFASYAEGVSQLCFMLLMLLAALTSVRIILKHAEVPPIISALAFGTVILVLLYICFGRTVAMHYTGYMKAANLFYFLIPLFVAFRSPTAYKKNCIFSLMLMIFLTTGLYFWKDSVLVKSFNYSPYTRSSEVTKVSSAECLHVYDADIRLVGMETLDSNNSLISNNESRPLIYWVELTNHSGEPFMAFQGKGSVNMSYHWLSTDGSAVVKDGVRSMIPEGIENGKSARIPVVVEFPEMRGDFMLRLTPVQEGCAWFYQSNPASKLDIPFTIR